MGSAPKGNAMKLLFAPDTLPVPKAQLPDIFNPQGFSAQAIADVFIIVLAISGFILLIVIGMVGYALVKNRDRGEGGYGKLIYGNNALEITWTIIPLVIVAGLIVVSIIAAKDADPDPPDELGQDAKALGQVPDEKFEIIVRGHQWWWEFEYPKHGIWTANELHIPAGKSLFLKIRSADVIHDFWVPQLARKIDAIPGWDNHIWIQADQPGWYHGVCAEYCGNQHAWMRFDVVAETQEEFDAWALHQKQDAPSPQTQMEKEGYALFANNTCGNCHTIKGTGFNMTIGPDLTHLMSRKYLGSGVRELNHQNLFEWMKDAQAIKPGCHMPNFQFTDDEAAKITAYLESLK
jgi:cytochrome c oxidase subunit II